VIVYPHCLPNGPAKIHDYGSLFARAGGASPWIRQAFRVSGKISSFQNREYGRGGQYHQPSHDHSGRRAHRRGRSARRDRRLIGKNRKQISTFFEGGRSAGAVYDLFSPTTVVVQKNSIPRKAVNVTVSYTGSRRLKILALFSHLDTSREAPKILFFKGF